MKESKVKDLRLKLKAKETLKLLQTVSKTFKNACIKEKAKTCTFKGISAKSRKTTNKGASYINEKCKLLIKEKLSGHCQTFKNITQKGIKKRVRESCQAAAREIKQITCECGTKYNWKIE